MILKGKELEKVIFGAIGFEEADGAVHPIRLTEAQKAAVVANDPNHMLRCDWASGIWIEFETDSKDMRLEFCVGDEGMLPFEVYENGLMTGEYRFNHNDGSRFAVEHTFHFDGKKRVQIWFTVRARVDVISLECENIVPVTKCKNVAFIGDSITQGWTSEHASCAYTAILTRALGEVNAVNYGIGGYIHDPAFTKAPLAVMPDLVFVAFGTNDYGKWGGDAEKYKTALVGFYDNLTAQTGDTPIFAFTPIWRDDRTEEENYRWRGVQKSVLSQYPSVTVLDGELLVPHVKSFYQDLRLHPNDKGMMAYAENILGIAGEKICAALNK